LLNVERPTRKFPIHSHLNKVIFIFDSLKDYSNPLLITMSNQLELRHLRYFLAVADDLHFRKAAEKLFISQPGLSRQIKQMEEDLGLNLFERHNRKVKLTPTGEYLQKEIQIIFKNLDAVLKHAQLLEKGFEGRLKLGYIGSAMQNIIPEFLLAIKKNFPNVRFDLTEMDNQKQIETILNQDIDIGFVRMDRVPRDVAIRPVFEDTFSLVLPKNHKIGKRNFKDLSQLKEESFILFDASYSKSYFEKVMQIFDDSGFSPIISHNTVKANTIYTLVENNFGVAIVPTALKKGYDKKIKFIELTKIHHRTTLRMIWNKKNSNPILKNALELIKEN